MKFFNQVEVDQPVGWGRFVQVLVKIILDSVNHLRMDFMQKSLMADCCLNHFCKEFRRGCLNGF